MVNLTHLVGLYRSATHRPEYPSGHAGMVTFDAGEGMLLCANELGDDSLEFFASPGYMSADELAFLPVRSKTGEEDVDILERWQSNGAVWSIDVDRQSGLVTLSCTRPEAPWDLAGFKEAVETFWREYRTWEARLRAARDPETVLPPDAPDDEEDHLVRAMHLRA